LTTSTTSEGTGAALARREWTGRSRGGVVGNWIFVTLVRLFGLRPAYVLLAFVALYYVAFAPRARRASDDFRLRAGFGGRAWPRRLWGAWRHFFTFGQLLLDRVAIISGPPGRFQFRFEGEDHIRTALAQGSGAVIVSAHFGNWEVAGHLLGRIGSPVNVVAYRGEAAHVRRLFENVLRDRAFSLIEADGSPETGLAIMAALGRGELVALHGDRLLDGPGVRVPFLGAPASFPAGPHVVAAVSGAPMLHAYAIREGTHRYRFFAHPPEHLEFDSRATRDERIRQWTEHYASRLEAQVRRHPLQWCNFYPFWDAGAADSASQEDAA